MKKRYSLKDIALKSGVSIGTVDRVIHNRGRVSKESIDKVNQVLRGIDYIPNPIARSLKKNTVHKINVLIPDPKMDPYWTPCEEGIKEVVAEFCAFDIDVIIKKFNPSNSKSFSLKGYNLINDNPNALLFVPLFDNESERLLDKVEKENILTATFNSPSGKKVGSHVGQDLFLSGRVAAQLLQRSISPTSDIGVIHIDESINNSTHMQEKENGFKMYFKEQKVKRNLQIFTLKTSELKNCLGTLTDKNPNLDAFFVTTSKSYEVAAAVKSIGVDAKIIGYDLLPKNVEHLTDGTIEYLIHQSPKTQAYLSLKGIVEKLLFNKELASQQLLPIEIISSENIKSYT